MPTTTYRISNTTTGHIFGEYEGEDMDDALDTYAKDAGYADYDDLTDTLGGDDYDDSDILVEEVEQTEPLTDDMISTLRREAGAAGDTMQVEFCDEALDGDEAARAECACAINNARGMDDSVPFVRVVP